jgi:hypothetical protein
MAQYKLLTDHFIGGSVLEAGSVVTDTGPSAQLPANWVPTTAVDALDNDGISKFWTAGPAGQSTADPNRSLGPYFSGGHFVGVPIGAPAIYWKAVPGSTTHEFILTGAGAALGPTNIVRGSVNS